VAQENLLSDPSTHPKLALSSMRMIENHFERRRGAFVREKRLMCLTLRLATLSGGFFERGRDILTFEFLMSSGALSRLSSDKF
jgi:hypothetical protein